MTGDQFITVASRWAANPAAGEAAFRSSVSRAYYGVFHLAKELLVDLGFGIPNGANGHGLVRIFLLESGHANAVESGRLLKDLHSDRIKADYRLDVYDAATQAAALVAVETATDASRLIQSCSNEPDRTVLRIGVESYTKKLEAGRSQWQKSSTPKDS